MKMRKHVAGGRKVFWRCLALGLSGHAGLRRLRAAGDRHRNQPAATKTLTIPNCSPSGRNRCRMCRW